MMKYILLILLILLSVITTSTAAQADVNFNNTDDWSGTSGSMIPHGDGGLRAPPSVTTGLVSYWNPGTDVGSGSTLTDIWGSNDGTIYGATWNTTTGMLYFDGSGDYVNCGNDESLNITGETSMVSTIIMNYANHHPYILSKRNSTSQNYNIFMSDEEVLSIIDGDGDAKSTTLETTFGEIEHVAITINSSGTEYIGYVNGHMGPNLTMANFSGNDVDLYLGYRVSGTGSHYLKGLIGSTYIYNTTLINSQINETRDNYHTSSSYVQIDSVQDAGVGNIWDNIQVSGTDAGANTALSIYLNGSSDNVVFNGLELIGEYDVNDLVDIPADKEYRYAKFKILSTTTYQPETNVIDNIEIIIGLKVNVSTSEIFVLPYSDTAYVMWTSNLPSNNIVEYSLNSDMSASSNSEWDNITTSPQILLGGLTRDTTYYYEVSSTYGRDTTTSETLSFTTQNNTHGFTYYFDKAFVVNDIDGWSVGESMFESYADVVGAYIMWTLILGSVFLVMTIRMESVVVPVVLSLISAAFLFPLLPPEHDIPAKVILGLSITGILWHLFIGRR